MLSAGLLGVILDTFPTDSGAISKMNIVFTILDLSDPLHVCPTVVRATRLMRIE